MAWDFETEPEYEAKLAWARAFVDEEILPLETLDLDYDDLPRVIRPLQEEVKRTGPVGRPPPPRARGHGLRPGAAGTAARDPGPLAPRPRSSSATTPRTRATPSCWPSGIEATGATSSATQWLEPLLEGKLRSAFSMTEPGAGADPTLIPPRPCATASEWVINGHKWFTSNGSVADFLIVMCVTNPDVHPYQGCSMIVVPTDTPGVDIVRDVPTMEDPFPHFGKFGAHSEIIYRDVRVPVENLVGNEGDGFRLAQMRLGPGRIHHCMRWLGQSRRAFDMLCERAVSRHVHGSLLADKQMVQSWVADSMAEMAAARLMTLQAAWKMDRDGPAGGPGRDRHDQVLRRRRPLQRDRPGHPGPRVAGLLHRPAPRAHVPRRPGGPHLRRPRRGPQGHRGPPGPEALRPGRGAHRARPHPPARRPRRSSPTSWPR